MSNISQLTEHEIPIIISSDVNAGAQNKSADGSTFEIILEDAIDIPAQAKSCIIQVQEATVWWVIPNILTGINDTFYVEHGAANFVAVIPQGLYDLPGLNEALDRELTDPAVGAPAGLITFLADEPTQKVVIKLNLATTQVDFTQADTFRVLLGYDSQLIPAAGPSAAVDFQQIADNIANFSAIEYFLIHSDLVNRGIRTNNRYDQTIAQVLITVPPGSQQVSTPFNPPKVPAWELIGSIRNRATFWLTDQTGTLVNTNGEDFSARLVIKYVI